MATEAQPMTIHKQTLSIVVASQNAQASITECLSILRAQCSQESDEIVIVDNSTDGTTAMIREQFPDLKLITASPSALIPELWALGIRQSRGDIIVITSAHCVPDENWLQHIRTAHEIGTPAVGGAIENDPSATIIDWAVYFCRYSHYMLPFEKRFVAEIAGDNASYKRVFLNQCQEVWHRGFWEPNVHAELRKAGHRLLLEPTIVIWHKKSFALHGFIQQRFQHGTRFGQWRASHLTTEKRVCYILLAPIILFVLLGRIGRQVMVKRRHLLQFVSSLPALMLFLIAWTAGEVAGSLRRPGT